MFKAYQTIQDDEVDRKDHCWVHLKNGDYKCVLCGALTVQPPVYPTPRNWIPRRYEPLTKDERNLCPGPVIRD